MVERRVGHNPFSRRFHAALRTKTRAFPGTAIKSHHAALWAFAPSAPRRLHTAFHCRKIFNFHLTPGFGSSTPAPAT